MTMSAALEQVSPEQLPLVVAEIQDTRYISTLRALYPGPLEIVAGDEVISRLMVQNVRHPGLSHVFGELTGVSGSQIHIREEPQLAGVAVKQLRYAFPEGVLLGVVRPHGDSFQALLNPPNDLHLETGDRIAVLAPRHEAAAGPENLGVAPVHVEPAQRRVLVLGWNHRVPALLDEFASYPKEQFTIETLCRRCQRQNARSAPLLRRSP